MKKIAVAGIAALGLLGAWVATAGPNDTRPEARAYFSVPFGGSRHAPKEPLHYGLRLDYDSRLRSAQGNPLPAVANLDFDTRGNRLALVGGVPFAGRVLPPLHQNEGDLPPEASSTGGGSGEGGFTFFDWSLLAVGVGGLGYLVYEISKSKESPDPEPDTPTPPGPVNVVSTLVNGTVNVVSTLVNGTVNVVATIVTSIVQTGVNGFAGVRTVDGALPIDPVANDGQTYQQWLDGGTGHMGDLKSH